MVDLDVLLTRPFKEFRDQKGKCYMNLVDQCNSSDMDELRKWAKFSRGDAAKALTKCVLLKMWDDDNCRLWYSK